MKILQINSVCGLGSTGRIATDLYKALEEQGHECVIAYGRGTAPEGIKTIKIGTDLDNYIHVAKTRLLDKHGLGSTKATNEFIKKVEEYDPDIIHLHNIHGYYLNIEILFNYLNKTEKKVVWTLHDCWSFTGHCCYFEYNSCDKWKNGCKDCIQLREYPQSIFVDNSKNNYSIKKKLFANRKDLTIVAVSEWLKNIVEQSFLSKNEILKISNGIDVDIFKSNKKNKYYEKYGLKNKKVILGVANVWDGRKGLNDFIKLSKLIDEDYSIVLVGLLDKQIKNLPENIIGITRTNNVEELVELYSNADVFINTSVEETFGMVNIEAMACGTPIIVYNCTASPETVNQEFSYIVDKNNINDILKCINEINKKGKQFYSDKCIDWVRKNYRKKDMFNLYIDLYYKILNVEK